MTTADSLTELGRVPDGPGPTPRRERRAPLGRGDRIFLGGSRASGLLVLVITASIGAFLFVKSLQSLRVAGFSFVTTQQWNPDTHHFGIAAVMTGTVLIALVAMVVSVPAAIGLALFVSEIAPRWIKQSLVSVIDLMAAVPSVVYGLWGLFTLENHVVGISRWISSWFGWIPIFKVTGSQHGNPLASSTVYTASTFIAGLVVSLMAGPIMCAVMREAFSQAPPGEREGAYALGGTRWGMIRTVVMPFGKGGIIGGIMLGLGRALGETIAVYLIISPVFKINFHILQTGANSVSSLITLRYGDATGFGLSALLAAGFALFVITMVVNFTASSILIRSRSGALSEA